MGARDVDPVFQQPAVGDAGECRHGYERYGDLESSATPKPFIFVNLSRHGSISIMQLLVPPNPSVHLIDAQI